MKRIKYNRVSNGKTQSGNRFLLDKSEYDITYLDKGSGLQSSLKENTKYNNGYV